MLANHRLLIPALLALLLAGCHLAPTQKCKPTVTEQSSSPVGEQVAPQSASLVSFQERADQEATAQVIQPTTGPQLGGGSDVGEQVGGDDEMPMPDSGSTTSQNAETIPPSTKVTTENDLPVCNLSLGRVINSTRLHFPTIREAAAGRIIASGEVLSAFGAFDHKFDGYTNGQPLDFYENSWHKYGIKRDTMWGGQVGAGYRLGRGSFEPWYKERETNDGGEWSVSLTAPIVRDRAIDANRAELWRSQLERGRIEPLVRGEVIFAVREASVAYWDWVAAGANREIAKDVLDLGLERMKFLKREVDVEAKAKIDLTDNQRIIVSRQAKAIDAQRKLEQTAAKLSLFFRDGNGQPCPIRTDCAPPSFPKVTAFTEEELAGDIEVAWSLRPELEELRIVQRQYSVALRQANNETLPNIDGGILAAQDTGLPTKDNDKSDFELEATLTISVPLERRKALGKVRQLNGKLAALRAKTQFASDKIAVEVQVARAALMAAALRVEQTREGVTLARQMQDAERKRYFQDDSSLFELNLRELQAADAAVALVAAQFDYFVALADYAAALGYDEVPNGSAPAGEPIPEPAAAP